MTAGGEGGDQLPRKTLGKRKGSNRDGDVGFSVMCGMDRH